MLAAAAVVGGGAALASAAYYYWWGKGSKVFGVPLDKALPSNASRVPTVVEEVVASLRADGLNDMGIFRQSGSKKKVLQLKELFDTGQAADLSTVDSYTRADLLKMYLRELPEPLFPFSAFGNVIDVEKEFEQEGEEKVWINVMSEIISRLPEANARLLQFLFEFLDEVASEEQHNAMSRRNLAIVFAPSVLRPTDIVSQMELLEITPVTINVISKCIEFHELLFGGHSSSSCSSLSDGSRTEQSQQKEDYDEDDEGEGIGGEEHTGHTSFVGPE